MALCVLTIQTAGISSAIAQEVTINNIAFIKIPAGEFVMGTSDKDRDALTEQKHWSKLFECERPAHTVTVSKPFLMGKFEVSQKEWKQVVGGKNPSAFKGDTLPVDSASWDEVQNFLKELNKKGGGKFRLPTEAEWEYACRAGSTGVFAQGAENVSITAGNLGDFAWFRENAENKSHPVGTKKPNAWGLYDMQGNVWEWCQDWYAPDFYTKGPVKDPVNSNASTERVFRGGSWFLDGNNQRAAFRSGNVPTFKSQYVGFRVVCEQ